MPTTLRAKLIIVGEYTDVIVVSLKRVIFPKIIKQFVWKSKSWLKRY